MQFVEAFTCFSSLILCTVLEDVQPKESHPLLLVVKLSDNGKNFHHKERKSMKNCNHCTL